MGIGPGSVSREKPDRDAHGKNPRQIQRYLTELEKAGLIERRARFNGKNGQINNAYSFRGLIEKLKAVEPEFTEEKQRKRARRTADTEAALEMTRALSSRSKTAEACLDAARALEGVVTALRKGRRNAGEPGTPISGSRAYIEKR